MNTNLVNQTAQEIREIRDILEILKIDTGISRKGGTINFTLSAQKSETLTRILTKDLEKKEKFVRMNLMQD